MKYDTQHGPNNEIAMHSLKFLNLFLLCVHACFLIFFLTAGISLMTVTNVLSLLFYIAGFWILKKERIAGYIAAAFAEIMLHMFLAILSLGWDYGFQLYFVGCIAVVFYADYFSAKLGKRYFNGVVFNVISGGLYFATLFIVRKWGALYEINDNVALLSLVLNSLIVFLFVSVFYRMLTKIAIFCEEELVKQANYDKLTGLANRYCLIDQLQKIYEKGGMSDYWLAILDIDNFKQVNDVYGHNGGDYVLRSVAELIQENCGNLMTCRWGGEEFVLVGRAEACNAASVQTEFVVLEKIRQTVARGHFEYEGKRISLTVTIGVSRYRIEQSIDEWINVADKKLYQGKRNGKNQVIM